MRFQAPPRSTYLWDAGVAWTLLCFSVNQDQRAAKMELVRHVVLDGIGPFRGLPNKLFDEQVAILRALLTAPVRIEPEEWRDLKARLHQRFQSLLETHQADLRKNLLGKSYT